MFWKRKQEPPHVCPRPELHLVFSNEEDGPYIRVLTAPNSIIVTYVEGVKYYACDGGIMTLGPIKFDIKHKWSPSLTNLEVKHPDV